MTKRADLENRVDAEQPPWISVGVIPATDER